MVVESGVLTTVQDRGRFGYAHLGVPRAGALDRPAATLANRLVGNDEDMAVLEAVLGGLVLRTTSGTWVALTGADAPAHVDDRAVPYGEAAWLPAGAALVVGRPSCGVRTYLAFSGGVAVAPVLGSRSRDTLAGIGPAPLRAGDRLPLGDPVGGPPGADVLPPRRASGLRLRPGPRPEWFPGDVLDRLRATAWTVLPASDRVGLRLDGDPVERRPGEIPSEGMVLGAVQVPPDGRPVVFLGDHPTTGGYPVAAVVDERDLWQCAQARPGERVRFR